MLYFLALRSLFFLFEQFLNFKNIFLLVCLHRNPDLRNDAGTLSFKRLLKYLARRRHVTHLEIESPLHFGAKDCLRLLSACTFSTVSFRSASNTSGAKRDFGIVRNQISTIMQTRQQLRGDAITLAQEVIDRLEPGITIDRVLDLDSSEEVSTVARPMCESLAKRTINARNLLMQHKQQLKSLGLTAPLFCEACAADSLATLSDEDVRALNIPPNNMPGIATKHDHLEDLLTFSILRLRYVETLGRALTSVLRQRNLLDSVTLRVQPGPDPALITRWVDRWARILKELGILNRRLTKATTLSTSKRKSTNVLQIRRRISLLVQRDLTSDVAPPQGWSIFSNAVKIAKDVHSSLRKAQKLCELKPEVFKFLSSTDENATAAPMPDDQRALTIGTLLRSPQLIHNQST